MVKLSELLESKVVKLDLSSGKKKGVIKELVEVLSKGGFLKDPEEVERALLERERKGSTGIGDGIGIPHAMVEGVLHTVIAFGRRREGIKFDAVDGNPVNFVFLLVGPKKDAGMHLRILAKLCRYLHNPIFRKALLEAETPEEVIKAFQGEEEREGL